MYGQYSRAVSNQEPVIVARVRYVRFYCPNIYTVIPGHQMPLELQQAYRLLTRNYWANWSIYYQVIWFFFSSYVFHNLALLVFCYQKCSELLWEQFLVTVCFFNCSWDFKIRKIIIQIGKNLWDLETCRKI